MKIFLVVLLTFAVAACTVVSKKSETGSPETVEQKIAMVSTGVDAPPAPIGGMSAIQAALRQPDEVWKDNRAGLVVVEAKINESGRVVQTRVAKSSGFNAIDAEAMVAVSRVTWKPARKKGTPVEAIVHVPVRFGPEQ